MTICLIFFLIQLLILSGCKGKDKDEINLPNEISYRDIPDITEEEIKAIKKIKNDYSYLIYGMPYSTELFIGLNGKHQGFSVLFAEWLSQIFEIPFKVELINRSELIEKLNSHEVAFTHDFAANNQLIKDFFITSGIISRYTKCYQLNSALSPEEITKSRKVKLGFINKGALITPVTSTMEENTYELFFFDDVSQVYESLKSGKIDAFYFSDSSDIYFINHPDVISSDFYPLSYIITALETKNHELRPIISAFDKLLADDRTYKKLVEF